MIAAVSARAAAASAMRRSNGCRRAARRAARPVGDRAARAAVGHAVFGVDLLAVAHEVEVVGHGAESVPVLGRTGSLGGTGDVDAGGDAVDRAGEGRSSIAPTATSENRRATRSAASACTSSTLTSEMRRSASSRSANSPRVSSAAAEPGHAGVGVFEGERRRPRELAEARRSSSAVTPCSASSLELVAHERGDRAALAGAQPAYMPKRPASE